MGWGSERKPAKPAASPVRKCGSDPAGNRTRFAKGGEVGGGEGEVGGGMLDGTISAKSQCIRRHGGNTARLARRSDKALGVRVSVARIAASLLDLGRGVPTGVHPTHKIIIFFLSHIDEWTKERLTLAQCLAHRDDEGWGTRVSVALSNPALLRIEHASWPACAGIMFSGRMLQSQSCTRSCFPCTHEVIRDGASCTVKRNCGRNWPWPLLGTHPSTRLERFRETRVKKKTALTQSLCRYRLSHEDFGRCSSKAESPPEICRSNCDSSCIPPVSLCSHTMGILAKSIALESAGQLGPGTYEIEMRWGWDLSQRYDGTGWNFTEINPPADGHVTRAVHKNFAVGFARRESNRVFRESGDTSLGLRCSLQHSFLTSHRFCQYVIHATASANTSSMPPLLPIRPPCHRFCQYVHHATASANSSSMPPLLPIRPPCHHFCQYVLHAIASANTSSMPPLLPIRPPCHRFCQYVLHATASANTSSMPPLLPIRPPCHRFCQFVLHATASANTSSMPPLLPIRPPCHRFCQYVLHATASANTSTMPPLLPIRPPCHRFCQYVLHATASANTSSMPPLSRVGGNEVHIPYLPTLTTYSRIRPNFTLPPFLVQFYTVSPGATTPGPVSGASCLAGTSFLAPAAGDCNFSRHPCFPSGGTRYEPEVWSHGGRAVRLLASHPRRTGFDPRAGSLPDFRKWESCVDDAADWRGIIGDLLFPPPLHSRLASPSSALKTSMLRSRRYRYNISLVQENNRTSQRGQQLDEPAVTQSDADRSPRVSGAKLFAVLPTTVEGCVAEETDGKHDDRGGPTDVQLD
ncbi:hypothetical protein PR048_032366 [Dryococelus australis]|uniref:Uncharacterized protein n=1 Tax=Dryococelus australis TaxID=614101 RepID=A0ABQ9G2V0_9NEOP|nr:hypothetical protein PR048_032366 [Dryococelus australis]